MGTAASPPFATADGKPANQGSTSGGGRDFTTDYVDKEGGGPGMIAKDRPQSEAKPEVEPNPQEIPEGGKVLLADPKGRAGDTGDSGPGAAGAAIPFRNLK